MPPASPSSPPPRVLALLIAADQATQDVVHAMVFESEDAEAFERLVRETVTVANYPLRGLVCDAAPPFVTAHADYFARLQLQLCRIHASRRLDFDIPKAKRSPDAPVRAELKERVRGVLFAPDEDEARRRSISTGGGTSPSTRVRWRSTRAAGIAKDREPLIESL